ncbi:MAG TPA: hypothetical protein VM689_13150 [Aliidongia sp.]|nr:hypothetical protein [Aliidongia sp.]
MNRLALSAFAIAALLGTFAGGARAFTYDGRASYDTSTNVSLHYQDPDPDSKFRSNNLSNSNAPGQNGSSGKFGNFSFKFSGGSSNGFGGPANQFVPSGNSAFGSPFGPNNLDLALGNRH